MNKDQLKLRTKKFALDIIMFVEALPKKGKTTEIIGRQLLRSGIPQSACRNPKYE